ncbi:MAG: hypothetical protein AAF725_17375, partial [Acidobacteriota bacterium]
MNEYVRPILRVALCLFLVLPSWADTVQAQESQPENTATSDQTQAPADRAPEDQTSEDQAQEDEAIYDEIVVTGGLIEDTVQDTPESVAVLNSDTITDSGATELQDIFNQTANAYPIANGEGF